MKDESAFTPEVEHFLAGELSNEDARALREKLGAEALARIMRTDQQERAELQLACPAEQFAALVHARVAREERARSRSWTAGLAAAVALVALLLWLPHERVMPRDEPGAEERIKGMTPELFVYRRTASGVEGLKRGARVRPRDTLQLAYIAAGYKHGVILSVDGAGAVTLHSPRQQAGGDVLAPSGRHMLEHAYELDAAPDFERFFFVTSQRPIDVGQVVQAARELARTPALARREALPLPSHYSQATFELEKDSP
jgi:hypothetical protein